MLDTAIRAAREAGRILLEGQRGEIEIDHVERRDIKLAMDRRAEEAIIGILRPAFPGHAVLSEECGRVGGRAEYTWVIDPLDGTFNYSRRIPAWCTSIGLLRDDDPVLGVIYDPGRDELFAAEKGRGARLNDQPIHASDTETMDHAIVGLSLGLRDGLEQHTLGANRRIALSAGKVRSFGAAALDLAWVACGRFDAFFEFGLKDWDVTAALAILRAAGAQISLRRHEPPTVSIACSNRRLHADLLRLIEW